MGIWLSRMEVDGVGGSGTALMFAMGIDIGAWLRVPAAVAGGVQGAASSAVLAASGVALV